MTKVDFNFDNLRFALAAFRQLPAESQEIIENAIAITREGDSRSNFANAEQLRNAIRKASVFSEDSRFPDVIANAFDFVIRRPVSLDKNKLKARIEALLNQMKETGLKINPDDFPISFQALKQDPILISRLLRTYTASALISPNFEILVQVTLEKLSKDSLFDPIGRESIKESLAELEEKLKIVSGDETELKTTRDQLLKLLALESLKKTYQKDSDHLSMLHDEDLANDAPYLDLLSGYLATYFMPNFLSTEHDRKFLLVDKSHVVKRFYEIVDEICENVFSQRVTLIQKDFRDFDQGLEANSIGTIRMSNISSFLSHDIFEGDNFFDRLDKLLMPGGKMIYLIRHKENSSSKDIDVPKLIANPEQYDFSICKKGLLDFGLVMNLLQGAYTKGYTAQIGHFDKMGNFIEGKSGYFDKATVPTELILRKAK
ncbi:MAG: hypothetical protein LW817_04535 [Candidatus Caenarcaniphilales bacterium]|jgi:hypothetical protein|nr:hypothetical protein [Candidatus Caenarcaniphilales bacterium]